MITHHYKQHNAIRALTAASFMVATAAFAAHPEASTHTGKGTAPVDKSGYHLFNPTPREHMRVMNPDIPMRTQSPYTVDAGHLQFEIEAFSYSEGKEHGAEFDAWEFGVANIKLGLTNWLDFEVIIPSYERHRVKAAHGEAAEEEHHAEKVDPHHAEGHAVKKAHAKETHGEKTHGSTHVTEGFGDMTLRLKFNLWGNDSGHTALGLIPYATLPTSSHSDEVEPGIVIPFAATLPGHTHLRVMSRVHFAHDAESGGRHVEWINSASVARQIVGGLEGYAEVWTRASDSSEHDFLATAGGGFIYAVNDDLHLDAGVHLGLNKAAPDVQVAVGMSIRF